ncbi:MAG: S46 family peptidase [Rhodospirillales bacterium]
MGLRLLTVWIAAVCCMHADEGLWLFNDFPKELVAKRYGYQVTDAFLDHLRLSSVRFNNGGSGSFISPRGLLFTNHHVGSDCIQKLSSAEHDYMANGFLAETEADERQCPDLEVNVLLKMEDVTPRVKGAAAPGATAAQANEQRKAEIARIESECAAKTGNRCDVVTLYSGGEYHLYQYKKYTDVRLVFAPEVGIAAFGGDPDNFTYPRYCLDFALFRAYENGKPVQPPDYLRWSHEGVKDNELVFVSGHPGTTGRLSTVAELEFARDVSYPLVLARLKSLINTLEAYSSQSEENRRVARDNLFSHQNSFKAYTGFLSGLRDPALMAEKKKQEAALRAAIDRDPEKKKQFGNCWTEVAAAYKTYRSLYKPFFLLERNAIRGSDLFTIARDVLRYSEETRKPNERRLREFTDASLPALEQEMYSPAPITPSMEIAVIADYFTFLRKELGANDPTVRALLNNQTPAEAAAHYVNTSKLADVAERKQLAKDPEAVKNSSDGMIVLARILDGPARRFRKEFEDRIEAVLVSSAGQIALARFAVYGANEYPDATFTLRLSFARVAGYRNKAGQPVPYATTFEGLYARATGKDPYKLPPRWIKMKPAINLDTPFDFVSTADTHGGNSGSPTVNGKGEIVGILFDGNIEGLPNRFVYTEQQARSVHVASQGIIEALRNVYNARRLLAEIGM